ncbi:MAG: 3-dehydroquinate synthase [Chlamydiae bacterium]|nr:3-dehydroquinate synthase [Chlamydiota bacterium]
MEKELKLKTHWKSQVTRIHFGMNAVFETKLPELLEKETRKCVIFVDSNIEKLYMTQLEKLDCKIFSFPAGEASKSRETKSMLEDHLLSHNFGRDSLVIGMGGGVVNDLSGFLASTYCRGIPHIQIPTSLLAMVDAAIGGKTSVNTPYGKNMIGSFSPPREVWIDGGFLRTLPKKQWTNGIVEVIKAGLIASPSLIRSRLKDHQKWEQQDLTFIMDRIFESVSIKLDIVEKDPEEEKGLRRILNLGHTFGHALETLEDFQMNHGIAVAIGILISCFISNKMGLLSKSAFEEIEEIFRLYQIPLRLDKQHSIDDFMATLVLDKKAVQSSPRIVLLKSIGEVASFNGEYCTEVEFPLLEEAIFWMHERFSHE